MTFGKFVKEVTDIPIHASLKAKLDALYFMYKINPKIFIEVYNKQLMPRARGSSKNVAFLVLLPLFLEEFDKKGGLD